MDNIKEADDKLDDDQGEIAKYLDAIESKQGTCAADKKKRETERHDKFCDQKLEVYKACVGAAGKIDDTKSSLDAISQFQETQELAKMTRDQKKKYLDAKKELLENSKSDVSESSLSCGVAKSEMDSACAESVSENEDKDEDEITSAKKKPGSRAGSKAMTKE